MTSFRFWLGLDFLLLSSLSFALAEMLPALARWSQPSPMSEKSPALSAKIAIWFAIVYCCVNFFPSPIEISLVKSKTASNCAARQRGVVGPRPALLLCGAHATDFSFGFFQNLCSFPQECFPFWRINMRFDCTASPWIARMILDVEVGWGCSLLTRQPAFPTLCSLPFHS